MMVVPFAEAQSSQNQTQPAPASPGNSTGQAPDNSTPAQPSPQSAAAQPTGDGQLPNSPQAQQNNSTQPVGTAAAPYETPVGAAVSRPAGAAIAPGKQKRRRIFLIKVGLVVGGAIAIGTVIGLSEASHSKPNQ
jgi:hypothetical protein